MDYHPSQTRAACDRPANGPEDLFNIPTSLEQVRETLLQPDIPMTGVKSIPSRLYRLKEMGDGPRGTLWRRLIHTMLIRRR